MVRVRTKSQDDKQGKEEEMKKEDSFCFLLVGRNGGDERQGARKKRAMGIALYT
jgi:hypothetical protein